MPKKQTNRTIEKQAFERGAKAAAEIADSYNAVTNHPYRLGDCILGKLNIRKSKPRKKSLASKKKHEENKFHHLHELKEDLNFFDDLYEKYNS